MSEDLLGVSSLEELADAQYGRRLHPDRAPLRFAPQSAKRPRAYDAMPCVMIVATEATSHLHRALLESVEVMQAVTASFKVVIFTETAGASGLRSFGWAVEHCFSECSWAALSETDWLGMSLQRLDWAQQAYGVSYLIAAQHRHDALDLLQDLGEKFDVPAPAVAAARAHFQDTFDPSAPQSHRTLRGWLKHVEPGRSVHTVHLPGDTSAEVEIHRAGEDVLVTAEAEGGALLEEARQFGWSTAAITVRGSHRGPELMAAVAAGLTRSRSLTPGTPGCAVALGSSDDTRLRATEEGVFDATMRPLPGGGYRVQTGYGRELDVADGDGSRALELVRSVSRMASALGSAPPMS